MTKELISLSAEQRQILYEKLLKPKKQVFDQVECVQKLKDTVKPHVEKILNAVAKRHKFQLDLQKKDAFIEWHLVKSCSDFKLPFGTCILIDIILVVNVAYSFPQ